jgi:bifunctional DNA-binding transcriptional regulator/antitoxin component of YhaV-PrlF toxin-antitoxin module
MHDPLMTPARISRGGQISIPAPVRRRWGTDRVLIDDRGDALVVRPLPDDPIAAVRGMFRPMHGERRPSSDELRREAREEEAEAEARRRP